MKNDNIGMGIPNIYRGIVNAMTVLAHHCTITGVPLDLGVRVFDP